MPSQDVHEQLLKTIGAAIPKQSGASVVAITGFFFTGKTALSQTLAARWNRGAAVHLPSEASILDRDERLARGLDGCTAEGHDVVGYRKLILGLKMGMRTQVPTYSWQVGKIVGVTSEHVGDGGLIVVDGSVCAEPDITDLCEATVFMIPDDANRWLGNAIARDIELRAWDLPNSIRQNRIKAQTVVDQMRAAADEITVFATAHCDDRGELSHEIITAEQAEMFACQIEALIGPHRARDLQGLADPASNAPSRALGSKRESSSLQCP